MNLSTTNSTLDHLQSSAYTMTLPDNRTIQRGLLGLSVVFATLSLLPPLKFVGSLALRSSSFLSATTICAEKWAKSDLLSKMTKCAKVAVVALGIAAVAASKSMLLVAALTADIGLQAIEIGKSIYHSDYAKTAIHAGVLAVDAFTLAAALTASWPLMTTAAAISALMLTGATIKAACEALTSGDCFEAWCYGTLALLNVISAFKIAEISRSVAVTSHYKVTNTHEHDLVFKDAKGNIIITAKPGETVTFEVATDKTSPNYVLVPIYNQTTQKTDYHHIIVGYKVYGSVVDAQGNVIEKDTFLSKYSDYEKRISQEAMPAKDFPTLPVSGSVIVGRQLA